MTYEEALYQITNYWLDDEESQKELREAAKVFRETLEKQMPKKPLDDKMYFGVGKCPVCGVVFFSKDLITQYCGNCGQALDWSENDG